MPALPLPLTSLQGGHAAMASPAGEEKSAPLRRHKNRLRPQPGAAGLAGMLSPLPAAAPGCWSLRDYNTQRALRGEARTPLKHSSSPLCCFPLAPIPGTCKGRMEISRFLP